MIHLNAGNLWDNEYLDEVIRMNEVFFVTGIRVSSLFGSISGLTPTARSADRIPYRDWAFVDKYIDKARSNNITIRYTLNASCIGSLQDFKRDWDAKLKSDIQELHNIGVREWTVTSPLLVELLAKMFPNDFIEVSTIAEIATPEEAWRWTKLGAGGVNLSTSINRDFSMIEEIKDTGIEVSILANEACLFRCPWRRECYNLSSHNSERRADLFDSYPFSYCNAVRMADPAEWIKSRLLLPQWLKKYQADLGVDWFKIAFRTHPKEVALPILRHYMKQDFHGNLLELWPTIAQLGHTAEPQLMTNIPVDKLEELSFLEHFEDSDCAMTNCDGCGYCDQIYRDTQNG